MRALERKLLRDLYRLRGQVLTIVLVMACGVGSYVTMQTAYRSLSRAQLAFYEGHRFPDIFAHLKRAPNTLRARLAELPDVRFETRIVEDALLPVPGLSEPARMAIVSLPDPTGAGLARLYLRRGRLPDAQHADEAVLSEAFSDAHGLEPGARLSIVMGGARRSLLVVGVALSPEYVFAIGGSGMVQDSKRFGILWLPTAALEPVYAMDASFNDVVVKLSNPKRERDTIDALDRLLGPYGGQGAYARERQVSHMILKSELTQLEQYATVTPAIFLGVSAFLLNLVMSRLLNLQRGQIAALKALGYYDREIVAHYLKLASLVAILGSIFGVLLGAYLGRGMLDLYRPYFRFPNIRYVLEARTVAVAVLICSSFAIGGAWLSVRGVLALSPAEAMLPEAPPNYGRFGLPRWLRYLVGPAERMVLRELLRRPVRTLLSIVGVAFSVAIMVTARFSFDAVDSMMQMSFETARTEDFEVQFRKPVSTTALNELLALPGVLRVEPELGIPVKLRANQHVRDVVLEGRLPEATLQRIVAFPLQIVAVPERGAVISEELARVLGVKPGQTLRIEPYAGDRRARELLVAGRVADTFGLRVHMSLESLCRTFDEWGVMSSALLRVDGQRETELLSRLSDTPMVLSVTRRQAIIDRFRQQTADNMYAVTFVLTAFAATIAVGVVYNNARIALALRARDLSSLRVLGFTRAEISQVLLGELFVQVFVALPIGLGIGVRLSHWLFSSMDRELYRFPVVISGRTYAFACLVTLLAAALSALLVRRRLDRLDLVAVLKTRE